MVNKVYTKCIKHDPNCANQYIINQINWTFCDLYKREKAKRAKIEAALTQSILYNDSVDFDFSNIQREILINALNSLSTEERDLINRVLFLDENYQEIAKDDGVCANTIKRKLQGIYNKLAKALC